MMKAEFKFAIDQEVKIIGAGITGVVEAIYIDRDLIHHFSVRYFDNSGAKQVQYFRRADLEAVDPAPVTKPSKSANGR